MAEHSSFSCCKQNNEDINSTPTVFYPHTQWYAHVKTKQNHDSHVKRKVNTGMRQTPGSSPLVPDNVNPGSGELLSHGIKLTGWIILTAATEKVGRVKKNVFLNVNSLTCNCLYLYQKLNGWSSRWCNLFWCGVLPVYVMLCIRCVQRHVEIK